MDSKQSAKVSVIVPVYNVEKYIRCCLDSILNQSYSNVEVICVNDGSTDSCLLILNEYKKRDDRIIVVDKENGGLSSARNCAMDYISGKYLMFVDGDDWIDADTCSNAVETVEKYNCDIVIWNYIREYSNKSKPRHIFDQELIEFDTEEKCRVIQRRFLGLFREELSTPSKANSLDTAWGKLYRADIIKNNDIRFIDTSIIGTEDALFNLYVFGYAKKTIYIDRLFYHYRKDNFSSLTKKYKKDLKTQWNTLHEMMKDYIIKHHCDDSFSEALGNRICLSIIGLGLNAINSNKPINEIKQIITSLEYRKAISNMKFQYLTFHWKFFFFLAKYKMSVLLFLMLKLMKALKS